MRNGKAKMRKILTKAEQRKIDKYGAIVKKEIDKLDPIGLLAMDCPKDEYKSEIQSISLKMYESWSKESGYNFLKLAEVMYIVFAYQFGIAEAGNVAKYVNTASNILKEIKNKKTKIIDDMEKKYPMLYRRHKRTVMAHPDGIVTHDADCGIYTPFLNICTCGLHHELITIDDDDVMKIYPKYYDEWDGKIMVEVLLQIKEEKGLWTVCDECEGSEIDDTELQNCPVCEGNGLIPFEMPEPIPDDVAKKILGDIFNKKDADDKIPEK